MRGQRFQIDLDSDVKSYDVEPSQTAGPSLDGMVRDIKERVIPPDGNPPLPPLFKSSKTGFPAHRSRTGPSKFKRQREDQSSNRGGNAVCPTPDVASEPDSDASVGSSLPVGASREPNMHSIDEENKQRLARMSAEEIEDARQELMSGLSPSLIDKLLRKANIDDSRTDLEDGLMPRHTEERVRSKTSPKRVTFENPKPAPKSSAPAQTPLQYSDPDAPPLQPPPDLQPAFSQDLLPPPSKIHFPKPPPAPELDPSDPDFLSALHSTYFPSLPSDPSTLAWMTPIDPKGVSESTYSPSQSFLHPSSLRFDFRGHLLPPRLSSQIPSTKGLHHHAHAPSSAGYTIPELAHLARSAYPAQRCIAYQTLGRVLYRLGRGDFGREGDDLCEGIWQLVEEGRVIEGLVNAAGKGEEGANRSVWATATDAVWLWRKGGGRRWKGR